MAEAEGIPPTASVASVGPGIRYLSFTTGSGLIVAKIQFNSIITNATDFKYLVYFNESVVQGYIILEGLDRGRADTAIRVVVPPFTIVRCTAENVEDTNSRDNCVSFTGRVYGAE